MQQLMIVTHELGDLYRTHIELSQLIEDELGAGRIHQLRYSPIDLSVKMVKLVKS